VKDNALIYVEGLKKHYIGGTVKALDGVDLEIDRGEVVVIIGPSGSGNRQFYVHLTYSKYPLPAA